ncbi:DNA glycosylase [Infundibulicybe gibba]|nr:DNA glycosylase [Infundibulicybe gibba]
MSKRKRPNLDLVSEPEWESPASASASEDGSDFGSAFKPRNRKKATAKNPRKKKMKCADVKSLVMLEPKSKHDCDNITALTLHPKSYHTIRSPEAIRKALLQWYAGIHDSRGMPWRKPFDPSQGPTERAQRAYEVWVSEIMLQQTQVATVIPYYNRWMAKFPTISDLAASDIDCVNALWKGLGYYSRASRLLAGAKKAVDIYNGRLPDNARDMEANIPGIGRYSAGAIASIAYGEHVPVVSFAVLFDPALEILSQQLDGNVHRLLSRFLALHAPPKTKATLDVLWDAAIAMVQTKSQDGAPPNDRTAPVVDDGPPHYPGDINQALIELGSTICKFRDPACEACPLKTWCMAYAGGVLPSLPLDIPDIEECCGLCEPLPEGSGVTAYPMKANKKKAREELDVVSVVEWSYQGERRFLMVQRPKKGLLAGLWEFPTISDVSTTIPLGNLYKTAYDSLASLLNVRYPGSSPALPSPLHIGHVRQVGEITHIFSHIKKTYRVQWITLAGGEKPPGLTSTAIATQIPSHTRKTKSNPPATSPKPSAMWTLLDDVQDTNISTGVAKIWKLIQNCWDV